MNEKHMIKDEFPTAFGDGWAFERLYNELRIAAQEYTPLRAVALKLYQLGYERGCDHGQMT